jgi:hypothetical protein
LAIRLTRDASRAFGLVHGGIADAKASRGFTRGGCQFSHGGDLPPRVMAMQTFSVTV